MRVVLLKQGKSEDKWSVWGWECEEGYSFLMFALYDKLDGFGFVSDVSKNLVIEGQGWDGRFKGHQWESQLRGRPIY